MTRWHGPGKHAFEGDPRLTYEDRILPPRRRLRALKQVEADERNDETPFESRRVWREGPAETRQR